MMKFIKRILFALSFVSVLATAQEAEIVGTWSGQLEVAPGNSITVLFELSNEDGTYSAVLNSPDMGAIKNIAASSVSFTAGKLDIAVDALSGSYSGMLSNETFEGEWTQPGSTLAMNLSPYEEEVLSDESIAILMGQWHGEVMMPGLAFNIVFHFERDEDGLFQGFIQNADAGPNKQPLEGISLNGNEFVFRVPAAQAEYRGTLEGDNITGQLKQGGQDMELNVERGEYIAEIPVLELSNSDYETLSGSWTGKISTPQGELAMVLRVEKNDDGTIVAFIDSPNQGANGMKVTTASLNDGHLAFSLNVPPAEFGGDLEGEAITGNWKQGPMNMPLTFTKGEYVEEMADLALTDSDYEALAGKWSGSIKTPQGELVINLRVERNSAGTIVAFIDSVTQGANGMKVSSASLTDGKLAIALSTPPAKYEGELDGATLTGNWIQGPATMELNLSRE